MDDQKKPQQKIPIPRSRRGLKTYWNEVAREMKKVSWPTVAETNRLTGIVLGVCVLIGAIMILMSSAFGMIVDLLTKGSV